MTRETLKQCERALVRWKVELEDHLEKISNLDDELQKDTREQLQSINTALEEIEKESY